MHVRKWIDFLREYRHFKRHARRSFNTAASITLRPCLGDKDKPIEARGHYFHQDLLVAQKLFRNNPAKHVDVGSRMDGFVAHIASFREIEVIDIRPLEIDIPNVKFIQADTTDSNFNMKDYCDSLSSLHAIEHFGLGRYGDTIDLNGYLKGIESFHNMLVIKGKLYFSVPIGRQHIEFNAHRVFSLPFLLDLFEDYYELNSFSYVDDNGQLITNPPLKGYDAENSFFCHYGCGIFELTKIKEDIPLFGKQRIASLRPVRNSHTSLLNRYWLVGTLPEKVFSLFADDAAGAPTRREERLIAELKERIRNHKTRTKQITYFAGNEWVDKLERLNHLILADNLGRFLRWDVIQDTMFVTKAAYIKTELEHLRRKSLWKKRWRGAIQEVAVGNPVPFSEHPQSSANLIHHAYHICKLEENTGVEIGDQQFIFEFGGGYGSMCRLARKLGFKGTYVIFDLPPFSALQRYYLEAIGVTVYDGHLHEEYGDCAFCLSDLKQLRTLLSRSRNRKEKFLFIATWSISEAPLELRHHIMSMTSEADSYLFTYQDIYAGIDNQRYFQKLRRDHPDIKWKSWEIGHLSANYYLIGHSA